MSETKAAASITREALVTTQKILVRSWERIAGTRYPHFGVRGETTEWTVEVGTSMRMLDGLCLARVSPRHDSLIGV